MVKFRAPKICESSVWILLHVNNLTPKILRWFLDCWNICSPLANVSSIEALTTILHFFPTEYLRISRYSQNNSTSLNKYIYYTVLYNSVTFIFIDQSATGIIAPCPLITYLVMSCVVFSEVSHSFSTDTLFPFPLSSNRGKVQCQKKMRFCVAATRSDLKNFLYQDCGLWFLSSIVLSFFLPSLPFLISY